MPEYRIYPKEGEPFTLTFERFEVIERGDGFVLYDNANNSSDDGFLAFENVAAIIPVNQRRVQGLLEFVVHLKNQNPFSIYANKLESDPEISFYYVSYDIVGTPIGNPRKVPNIYVALSDVVAILPSDGLQAYRERD